MKKLLFIGNSATYVHQIPQWLARVAEPFGHHLQVQQITPGGCTLARHADPGTEHGQAVFAEIAKGYDAVFLQDHGNCITTAGLTQASLDACRHLADAIKRSGAKLYYYVRPPYGKPLNGMAAPEQCRLFDAHFSASAMQTGAECIYANRSFAYALRRLELPLWGDDNAHTSPYGAFLIVCTLFATLFRQSATLLDPSPLEPEAAKALAQVADKIVFDHVLPW